MLFYLRDLLNIIICNNKIEIIFKIFKIKIKVKSKSQNSLEKKYNASWMILQFIIFLMNKLFGFFKQKLIQAREENKQQLDNIVNALGNAEPYQSQKTLSHLQKIKENYMTWSILIANQASTGLFYSQLHNRNVCLKKIHTNKQSFSQKEKYQIVSDQMSKTHQELKQIANLNNNWVKQTTSKMDQLIQMFEPLESQRNQSLSEAQTKSELLRLKKYKSQKQIQQKRKVYSSEEQTQKDKKQQKLINSYQIII